MYGYIYLTENLINGMCYIGQHKSNKNNKSYKGSGKHLSNAFKKYGKHNFIKTIIQLCDSPDELNKAEDYWINKCNAVDSPYFYNLIPGGGNTFFVRDTSGENNPMYGSHRVGVDAPLYDKVCVNDGKQNYFVNKDMLSDVLSSGLRIGGVKRDYSLKRADASRRTVNEKIKNGFNTSGYAWFKNINTLDNVYIKTSDIHKVNYYTQLGYVRGNLTKEEKLLKKERGL